VSLRKIHIVFAVSFQSHQIIVDYHDCLHQAEVQELLLIGNGHNHSNQDNRRVEALRVEEYGEYYYYAGPDVEVGRCLPVQVSEEVDYCGCVGK
jgi:hypothetical protein